MRVFLARARGLISDGLPLSCYRVSPLVNDAKNDSPDCLTPA
jgi:hypothetical protein